MLDAKPIVTFIEELIFERDSVLVALQSDKNNKDLQKKLAAWRDGYTLPEESQPIFENWPPECVVPIKNPQEGANGTIKVYLATCPEGETTHVLNSFRTRYRMGTAELVFRQASAAVIDAGLGTYFLPRLATAWQTHVKMLEDAQKSYEQSRPLDIEDHSKEIVSLHRAIGVSEDGKAQYDNLAYWRGHAINHLLDDPGLSNTEIAKRVGREPWELTKDKYFRILALIVRSDRKRRLSGFLNYDEKGKPNPDSSYTDPEPDD